ncbi:MAG TPA: hypothetical protein VMR52_04185 [Dehalococcoidia bacterium]|nr:hypothetical protein [Dehalococcoidia bacterium]
MKSKPVSSPTAYDWLGVHAKAPSELISASYWLAAGALQQRRGAGERIDETLFALTRAYEIVADPMRRAEYDVVLGHDYEPLTRRSLPKVRRTLRGRIFGRPQDFGAFDFYEVLGVSPDAPQQMLPEAWHIMRGQYLRLPPDSKRRKTLLGALDAAYKVLSSPESRARYDARMRTPALMRDEERATVETREALVEPAPPPLADPLQGKQEPSSGAAEQTASTAIPVYAETELTTDGRPTVSITPEPTTQEAPSSTTVDEIDETQGEVIEPEAKPEQESPKRVTPPLPQPNPDPPPATAATTSTTATNYGDDPRRPIGEVLRAFVAGCARAFGQVTAAAARFLGRRLRGVWRRGRGWLNDYRERRSHGRTLASPPPIQPPISAGSRFTRVPHTQVEQALLGRLATYMKDYQPDKTEADDSEPQG